MSDFGSLFAADTSEFNEKPITFAGNEWCPQYCMGKGSLKGYIVEIVEEALKAEGAPHRIILLPWLRALRLVEDGTYDGLLTPTVEGYSQFMFHQEAVGYQEYCFYTRKESAWKYQAYADLLGKKVAYLAESGFGDLDKYFIEHKDRIKTVEFAGGDDYQKRIFAFLASKRTDVIIITSDVYHHSLKQKELEDQFREAGCLGRQKLAVGLSPVKAKRSQLIGQILDSGIRKIHKNGQLAKILEKYGMKPWSPN